jgi:hypothetical protein
VKGLPIIPSLVDLEREYARLQREEPPLDASAASCLSQWARFDPRLAELLVARLAKDWRRVAAEQLRDALLEQPWPSAMGVLLENARLLLASERTSADPAVGRFDCWMRGALGGVERGRGELFFIGLRSFGGKLARDDARWSLDLYRRWGYLGRDLLINKDARLQGKLTLLSLGARRDAIGELLARRERFTVADYERKLGGWITRRQAERDLGQDPRVRAVGKTKARFYGRSSGKKA